MKKTTFAALLLIIMMLALSACGGTNEPVAADPPPAPEQAASAAASGGESNEGGVLRLALPTGTLFTGVFNMVYCIGNVDMLISYWMTEPLLSISDDLSYDQDGAATYAFDQDAQTLTLTMREGVKWHDGIPVTMDDLLYAYEILAHPDYEGYFFTPTLSYITGINEYRNGEADTIAGLQLSEDKNTLTIHFDQFMPSILEGGIWTYPLPRHQIGDVSIGDMAADERSRGQALGYGPFKIKNMVPGESVELERFDDYWQGKPKLDAVIITVMNPDMLPLAMERGEYDVAAFPTEAYANYQNPTTYTYVTEPDRWYQFTGFHMGHFDAASGLNVYDPNSKMSNLNLRQAIGYAVDIEAICRDFYNGLYGVNPTVLPPAYEIYNSPNVPGYPYDAEKAKALLDEAGYLDIDNDGFRENPSGQPLAINWAVSNTIPETVAQFKLQSWHDVGLNVQLLDGKMIDSNAFYDMLFNDDPKIDMFESGWIIEASPNLPGAWGRESIANFTRFTSPEMDALLENLDSPAAWDKDYRIQAYHDFQEYFYSQTPAIPTIWRSHLYAVGNHVSNFSITPVQFSSTYHLIEMK